MPESPRRWYQNEDGTPYVPKVEVTTPSGGSSGGLTDAELRAAPLPVSGPLTDAQLRASNVGVTVANFPALQPVSDGGSSLTVDGAVSLASSLPAGGNNIGDVDVLTMPALTPQAAASSAPIGAVSLGNSLGKTNVLLTGPLVTTTTTANQVILTYTVPAGKTLYLCYFDVMVRLTTFAATATNFGSASLQIGGASVYTALLAHAGVITPQGQRFAEPIALPAGTVLRWVCTPAATTSFTWQANVGAYEK